MAGKHATAERKAKALAEMDKLIKKMKKQTGYQFEYQVPDAHNKELAEVQQLENGVRLWEALAASLGIEVEEQASQEAA